MMKSRSRGFSLIELMTVIAIITIMAGVAIPDLIEMSRRNKLKKAEVEVYTSIQAARSVSIATHVSHIVKTDAKIGTEDYDLVVFQDANGSGDYDAGEPVIRKVILGDGVTMVATNPLMRWGVKGMPATGFGGTYTITHPKLKDPKSRVITIARIGSITLGVL